ncbi:TerC family protein [Mucilaginibacter terrae]|uniref:Tellurium resistance membrane protein TerC n=1 Tax=Mucilaginibacter terrae TaxID=1955052 RepID=A0ABU3GU12_9SPHI|nr:TerC family protein [Mucilaginibacter terrae]MDT3403273.1 putative tellurium resistance membrane protein TerC [Mucilaginibacter terrae]
MEFLTSAEAWVSLATLTLLEIVLGIDNIIFVSIQAGKLPEHQQAKARKLGLLGAMLTRVLLLLSISWIMKLTKPFIHLDQFINATDPAWKERLALSGRDIILLVGGLFLMYKSIHEIHENIDHNEEAEDNAKPHSFWGAIVQIMILDIVFSLDSVITAVGLADHVEVMVAAVVISVGIMMWAATPIANFVNTHPTVKMLALSFLLLIGVSLLAESFNQEIPKGYIYFSMAFAILVELLNLKVKAKNEKKRSAVNTFKEPPVE